MSNQAAPLRAQLLAEALGTAGLLLAIVGSGIMAERLAGGNRALALLANSLATGAGLFALISTFAPISGAHFNPAVSLAAWLSRSLSGRVAAMFILVQFAAALAGVLAAHALFADPLVQIATKSRSGAALMASEAVATIGLLLVIRTGARQHSPFLPAAIALYITAAYWFTPSTSFANPAVTLARAMTDTFTGIRPADVPGFLLAQLLAVALVFAIERVLWDGQESSR